MKFHNHRQKFSINLQVLISHLKTFASIKKQERGFHAIHTWFKSVSDLLWNQSCERFLNLSRKKLPSYPFNSLLCHSSFLAPKINTKDEKNSKAAHKNSAGYVRRFFWEATLLVIESNHPGIGNYKTKTNKTCFHCFFFTFFPSLSWRWAKLLFLYDPC